MFTTTAVRGPARGRRVALWALAAAVASACSGPAPVPAGPRSATTVPRATTAVSPSRTGVPRSPAAVTIRPVTDLAQAPASSPQVDPYGRVRFTFTSSTAKTVTVTGSWGRSYTDATSPLRASGRGRWSTVIGPLAAGLYTYSFTVDDGMASADPRNPNVIHSSPALTAFLVPGPSASLLTRHDVPHGQVTRLSYELTRPGAFGYVGDFSAGYIPPILADITDSGLLAPSQVSAINARTKLLRIYVGNKADVVYDNNIATRKLFDDHGVNYQFAGAYPDAGHCWRTWQRDLIDFAPRLFT